MSKHPAQPRDAPGLLTIAASVFGLTGFVVQPLFAVLGGGPAFFAAHGSVGADLVLLAAVAILVPPLVVGGWLGIAYGLWPARWSEVVAGTIGVLFAVVVVSALDRAAGLPTPVYLVLAIGVAVAVAVSYQRHRIVRLTAEATAFAPVLFAALLLLVSPAAAILDPTGSAGTGGAQRDTDVLLLVFDELALPALLDASGNVDGARFPSFARLADTSTWYANTSTVAPWTHLAVPALLTGTLPDRNAAPTAAEHPRNVLRMLAPSHEVLAMETVTYLCPPEECDAGAERSRRAMFADASTVYLHTLLPDGLAQRWLPPIADRWSGFAGDEAEEVLDDDDLEEGGVAAGAADQDARFRALLEDIRRDRAGPVLRFGHFLLPHLPARHLPDGTTYRGLELPPGLEHDWIRWIEGSDAVETSRQQYLLQTQYVDLLLGRLLDALEDAGRLDDTLLIVTSDHGITFQPGGSRRAVPLTEANIGDVVPVPLFVHYPGQISAAVDRAPRQIIDIAPTIAETLDVELGAEWDFDGHPLTDRAPRRERDFVGDTEVELPLSLDLEPAAAAYLDLFGDGGASHDVYRWGPVRDLVGREAASLVTDEVSTGISATLLTPPIGAVDPDAPSPALVRFGLSENPSTDGWLAVAVNGVVAGGGPVYRSGSAFFADVMVDPALLHPEVNRVEPFLVAENTLRPVRSGS